MSASVESQPIHRRMFGGPFVISFVLALAIGALAGSLVTRALDQGSVTSHSALGVGVGSDLVGWDAGKLEAMEGRVLAEQYRTSAVGWDAGKLEAMEGRVLAESFSTE